MFNSHLSHYINLYIDVKRKLGFKFKAQVGLFKMIDKALIEKGETGPGISREFAEFWYTKRPHESDRTRYGRSLLLREFCGFLASSGVITYCPRTPKPPRSNFIPYIFSHNQIKDILEASNTLSYKYRRSEASIQCILSTYLGHKNLDATNGYARLTSEVFPLWLEREKKVSTATRNTRLTALRSFLKFVRYDNIDCLNEIQKIMAIKAKKTLTVTVKYLTTEGVKLLLAQPDTSTPKGRRDLAMMALMYDSGCRVQELADLKVGYISFQNNPTIKIVGKGNKARLVPLINAQIDILKQYMKEHNLLTPEKNDHPLFFNSNGSKFTRQNISYMLINYANKARELHPELIPDTVSPHTLRHSKAMHLLQAGVNIVYIRDILGHATIRTTEIYAKADSKLKREAIEKAYVQLTPDTNAEWDNNSSLLDWLSKF